MRLTAFNSASANTNNYGSYYRLVNSSILRLKLNINTQSTYTTSIWTKTSPILKIFILYTHNTKYGNNYGNNNEYYDDYD